MRTILSALALVALAGCSTGPAFQTKPATVETISFPETQQVTTAIAGETMIAYGHKSSSRVLDIRQMTTFGRAQGEGRPILLGKCSSTVAPGRYYQTDNVTMPLGITVGSKELPCFGPVPTKMTEPDGTESFLSCTGSIPNSRVCVDSNIYYSVMPVYSQYGAPLGHHFTELKKDFQNISIINESNNGSRSLVKEFRYVKRDDNIFYFTYREYDDYPHHVVSEAQYQYDLSATNVIAFGNMRAQIINANDSQVEFTLLSNF